MVRSARRSGSRSTPSSEPRHMSLSTLGSSMRPRRTPLNSFCSSPEPLKRDSGRRPRSQRRVTSRATTTRRLLRWAWRHSSPSSRTVWRRGAWLPRVAEGVPPIPGQSGGVRPTVSSPFKCRIRVQHHQAQVRGASLIPNPRGSGQRDSGEVHLLQPDGGSSRDVRYRNCAGLREAGVDILR